MTADDPAFSEFTSTLADLNLKAGFTLSDSQKQRIQEIRDSVKEAHDNCPMRDETGAGEEDAVETFRF